MSPSLCLLTLVLWAAAAQTEVATTDQAPYSAQVLSISATGVQLDVGNKQLAVPLDKLRRMSFAKAAADQSGGNAAQQITLRDGSRFGYLTLALAGGKVRCELQAGAELELPAAAVQHVQLHKLTPAQWTQWQAIVQSRATADRLVLIRSADALEQLEGVVSVVNAEQVSFDFSGQVIEAPLTKLAGLCLFSAAPGTTATTAARGNTSQPAQGKLTAIVHDLSGNRWLVAAINLPQNSRQVELQLLAGATVILPLEQLAEIDFSSGSMQYLADLQPLSRSSHQNAGGGEPSAGTLALGLRVSGADELFGPRSRSVRSLGRVAMGPSLEFVGSGSITYRIPDGFTRLRGEVELAPSGNRFTPCQVSVLLENEVVWQELLSETGRRWTVDLPVSADGRLRIEVAAESQTPVGDLVLWHELRLVK